MKGELLDARSIAIRMHASLPGVHAWIQSGELRATLLNGRYVVKNEDLLSFRAARRKRAKVREQNRAQGGLQQTWTKLAIECVKSVCETHRTFTTADVWEKIAEDGLHEAPEPRALGAAMRHAISRGW